MIRKPHTCFFLRSFLRSMTALLDPAQIEERDRRRQKQLEHQVGFCVRSGAILMRRMGKKKVNTA